MNARSVATLLVVAFLLVSASSSAAEMRKWTRANGRQFDAEFVKREGAEVTLRNPDGTKMTVRMRNLSDEDRKYVEQHTKPGEKGGGNRNAGNEQPGVEMRKWTRPNGGQFEAEFVKREGPEVTLRKSDGTDMTVRMPRLSDEDRAYVRQLVRGATSPEMTPHTPVSETPDQPPADTGQQRGWLRDHLLADMQNLGTFDGDATAKVSSSVTSLTDDQVALLCQNYFLTRSKAEQDAYIYSLQQQGYSGEQLKAAKAGVADLLTEMQNQGDACYSQIQTMGEPVQYLAQVAYASIPGWCASAQCYVPDWYYGNGSFIGPYYNAGYCGVWAAPVCRAYYDHGSRFYKTYHRFGDRFYQRHSAQLALRSAKYFHEHDYRRSLAHDRLLSASSRLRQAGQHDARLSHASEHSKAAQNLTHGKGEEKVARGKAGENVAHGKAVAKPEHKAQENQEREDDAWLEKPNERQSNQGGSSDPSGKTSEGQDAEACQQGDEGKHDQGERGTP